MTMTAMRSLIDAPCPRHPEGVHQWALHDNGYGCHLCPAFMLLPRGPVPLVEETPAMSVPITRVLRPVPLPGYDELEDKVMTEIIRVAAMMDPSYLDVQHAAQAILEMVGVRR